MDQFQNTDDRMNVVDEIIIDQIFVKNPKSGQKEEVVQNANRPLGDPSTTSQMNFDEKHAACIEPSQKQSQPATSSAKSSSPGNASALDFVDQFFDKNFEAPYQRETELADDADDDINIYF